MSRPARDISVIISGTPIPVARVGGPARVVAMNNDLLTTSSGSTNPTSPTHPTPTSKEVSMTVVDAPARSDLPALSGSVVPAAPSAASKPSRPYRLHGTVLSVGALMWAAAIAVYGPNPADSAVGAMAFGIGSGTFQIGLLFLLRVLRRTDALGTGKVARTVLVVENAFVSLAIASMVADAVQISDLSQPGWLLLDGFWPISMIGMFGLAIRIAIAGRWRGVSRIWPLVAESWAVCVIPTMNIFGPQVAGTVAVIHLLIGYCVLGQIVARKTQ